MDVSIIIPTLNRASQLRVTLESILKQADAELAFEVIVVDNGSTDNTGDVCREFSPAFKNFRYVFDNVPGQLTGRHRGYEESGGEILCYLDDDVILNPEWLNSIYRLSQQHPEIAIFGGPSLPDFVIEPPSWFSSLWEKTPYGGKMCLPLSLIDLQKDNILIDPLYVFGLNFSIRRSDFILLKGFHPDCIPAELQHYQGDGETGLAIKAGLKNLGALHSASLTLHHQISADRLTEIYINKWSFYNGVCQSFTDLRYLNNLYPQKEKSNKKSGLLNFFVRTLNRIHGKVKSTGKNAETQALIAELTETYKKGYAFHQHAFTTNRKVRDWVLREDYLDYHLPS